VKLFLRHAWTIAAKDLRTELRNREVLPSAVAFAVVVLLLFSFAFDPITNPDSRSMAGGLLWIVYAFSGVLILNRGFARETANNCLSALVAAPISGGSIFVGKAAANTVLLLTLELISLPIFQIFYDVRWTQRFPDLLAILLLGTVALTSVGTMFGAVTANNRLRELMLPLLVFPMVLPALMACVELSSLVLTGEPFGPSMIWFKLLVSFDVIFALLGAGLLEYVLSA
jgi:heme exporter protein B